MLAPNNKTSKILYPEALRQWELMKDYKTRQYNVKFEVLKAVTKKNGVFWDIKTQLVLHRKHITSQLQIPAS
jgi:hypothetical protein